MTSYTVVIPGKPFAKQRTRATRQGRVYTPAETVSFERKVGIITGTVIKTPFTGPVKVTIRATFKPPESWSKKKVTATTHRPHAQRPDLDNVEKAILDGMNRIAFVDDCQVWSVEKSKVWGLIDQTVVFLEGEE